MLGWKVDKLPGSITGLKMKFVGALEIGCGKGFVIEKPRANYDCSGIDFNPEALRARTKVLKLFETLDMLAERHPGVRFDLIPFSPCD